MTRRFRFSRIHRIGLVLAALSALLLATGCATTAPEPIVRTVEVKIPVPVACVPKTLGAAPQYPDTDEVLRAQSDAAERYRLMAAGRKLRDARLGELEPIVKGCRVP